MASKSLIWHTFGSLARRSREAGFDVPVGEERLERAIADGAVLARRLGRLPKMADWKEARARDADAAVRVAGLPPRRRRSRAPGRRSSSSCAGGCARRASSVPRRTATRSERGARLGRRDQRASRSRQKRPSCGARTAGSDLVLAVAAVGLRSAPRRRSAATRVSRRPSSTSVLRNVSPQRPLDDLERGARRREEAPRGGRGRARAAGRRRVRRGARRGCARRSRRPPSRRRSSSSAGAVATACVHQREDRLGVDRHARARSRSIPCRARSSSSFDDDPVVDPGHRPWRTGWLFASDRRVALRVVADVDERLGRVGRERRRRRAARSRRSAACGRRVRPSRAVRVADGVGAALRDPGEQGLRRERPVDSRGVAEAVASDAAHRGFDHYSEAGRFCLTVRGSPRAR